MKEEYIGSEKTPNKTLMRNKRNKAGREEKSLKESWLLYY